jgi:hypothetical protein
VSPALGQLGPVAGARLARIAAATTPLAVDDAAHGAPDAREVGAHAAHDVSSPARLAAVGSATIARSETGAETVTFAPPPDESPAAAVAVTAPAGGSAPAATGSTQAATAPAPARSAAPPRVDVDDVYEQVVERLRHDLVTEYERMGQPLDDLPRC